MAPQPPKSVAGHMLCLHPVSLLSEAAPLARRSSLQILVSKNVQVSFYKIWYIIYTGAYAGGGGGGGGSGGSGEPPFFQINYIYSMAWHAYLACK